MNATPRKISLASAFLFCFFFSSLAVISPLSAQDEYSHARIVRLSFVEGNVTLLRPASVDWAAAAVNTPIEQGFQLSTDKNSFAEVEFENGSTARVGELSLLKFDELALSESGDELNRLVLDRGYGTFSAHPQNVGTFEVHSGSAVFTPQGKAEFRVDLNQAQTRLEVFKGSVDASSPEGVTTVAKDGILEIAPGTEQAFNLSSGIQRDDWDSWVADRNQQLVAADTAPPGGMSPGAPEYGWSDLNQYGTWSYFNGYGYGWVPDATGTWSPFSLGQWSYYPGWGYTWISYEPWGWLPYHFGGWEFDDLFGWAWFPGDYWGFSPGVVNWFEGPGWIGWAPQPPGRRPVRGLGGGKLPKPPQGCPSGCLNAVNVTTFQKGGRIEPRELMKVNANQAVAVRGPSLEPSLLAQLPGTPAKMSSAQRSMIEGRGPAVPILDRVAGISRISPQSGQWSHRAPEATFASPPSSVRGAASPNWGVAGSPRGPSGYGGGGSSRVGIASSASHGGGSFSAGASHGGGSISGGGGSAGGGGSHGGSSGGGGGHH